MRRVIDVQAAGGAFYVDSALGHSVLTEVDRFPDPSAAAQAGSLLAPMPGTVVRVEVALGDHVPAGAVILAIEAMKMEHAIRAPAAGVVADLPVAVGAQVDSGSVLAVLEDEGDEGDQMTDTDTAQAPPEVVRYELRNGVAWLTIDRPEARNALSRAVREGLFAGVRRFNADDEAKVLVLTGAGDRAFCAGGDLKEMADTALEVPPPDFLPQFGRNIEVAKPTIAAVNGVAYAGGFLLAQQCDLCVAAESARFAVTEVKVGRGSPWAAPLPG